MGEKLPKNRRRDAIRVDDRSTCRRKLARINRGKETTR